MFHFTRDRVRDGDPTKRVYGIIRGEVRVGVVRMTGVGEERTRLAVECGPELSEGDRDELRASIRSFVVELATGWGWPVAEVSEPDSGKWTEQPGGGFRLGLVFQIA